MRGTSKNKSPPSLLGHQSGGLQKTESAVILLQMETKNTAPSKGVRVALRVECIPRAFMGFAHWVVWKAKPKEDGDGFDKVPHNPRTGNRASSTDSRTWATFAEAIEAYESGRWDGIGFMFSSGDPFVGIDLDKCRNPETGEVSEDALEYARRFEHAYVEASVSGTGIHIITTGKLHGGTKRRGYEIYGQERFFAMTGEEIDV